MWNTTSYCHHLAELLKSHVLYTQSNFGILGNYNTYSRDKAMVLMVQLFIN